MAEINKGYIDEEARKELNKQVLKGTETAKEMNRTELNFYCEIFSMLKKLNEELATFNRQYTMANAKPIKDFAAAATYVNKDETNKNTDEGAKSC